MTTLNSEKSMRLYIGYSGERFSTLRDAKDSYTTMPVDDIIKEVREGASILCYNKKTERHISDVSIDIKNGKVVFGRPYKFK